MMTIGSHHTKDASELLKDLPHSILTADLDGNITYWNKASEELFGYTSSEMLNYSLEQIYSKEDKSKLFKKLRRLQEGKDVKFRGNAVKKDGSRVRLHLSARALSNKHGEPISILASMTNIDELKVARKDLEDITKQIETILETTVDGVANIDENGIIQSFNKAASKIFGYSEEEVQGQDYKILIPAHHKDGTSDYLKRIFNIEEKDFVGSRREITGQRKDGSIFPMELSITKTSYANKTIFTGVVNDISERRRLEQEILWISEEERRNIGQDMHDGLGQILTGIQLISKSLAQKLDKQGIAEAEEVLQIADMVKEANEQARALAHGLVHVGVEEDGILISFRRLCKRVHKLFNIECTLEIDSDIIIENDVTALNLYRITQEAINNAYKHGKADKVKIILEQEEEFIHLFIENNGIPFSLSENKEQPTGMGINIMRYRSHMISGRFDIVTTEEGYTRTCCKVPLDYCNIS